MNAVRADVIREIPGRDQSWIDACFNRWGEWLWLRRDYEGYPAADALMLSIFGAGGNTLGHRVLALEPPEAVRLTHALWVMLPEHEGLVVFAEYVPGVRDDGRMWTRAEKCTAVKVDPETFRKRLQRARSRIYEWSRVGKR